MNFGSVPFLAAVTPSGGSGGVLNLVGTPVAAEDFGDTIVQTIPAVGVGDSLLIFTINDKPDITVDGGTLAGTVTMAAGYILHAFLIENVTDSRTSVTIRSWTDATHTTPSGTNMIRRVFEVDAAAVDLAATIASATGSGTAVAVPITTTVADAAGFLIVSLSIDRTQTGGSGWTVAPGTSDYNPYGYNFSLGAAGAKSAAMTLGGGSADWAAGAIAFARG